MRKLRIKVNQDIYIKFKSPDTVTVEVRRLVWLGHVVGMDSKEVTRGQTRRRERGKHLRCFKLRLNRKLYVKRHADKLNVGDLFLRVLKCFSCLSEGRAEERKKLTVLEFVFFQKFLQVVICMCLCFCYG
jgi:hypothetical protein